MNPKEKQEAEKKIRAILDRTVNAKDWSDSGAEDEEALVTQLLDLVIEAVDAAVAEVY